MVTVLPELAQTQREDTSRLPLVPSAKNNVMPSINKPRAREISSRYSSGNLSPSGSNPSTTRRCSSPNAIHTKPMFPTLQSKRAQSAERGRPVTPSSRVSIPTSQSFRPSTPSSPSSRSMTQRHDTALEMHNRSRRSSSKNPDGLWPSVRNPSSSFRLESVASVPASKNETTDLTTRSDQTVKPPANCTPQRMKTPRNVSNQSENSQPVENSHARVTDQHHWPSRGARMLSANALLGSVDGRSRVHGSTSPSPVPSRGVSPKRTVAFDGANRGFQHHSLTQHYTDRSGRTKHVAKPDMNSTSQHSERSSFMTKVGTNQTLLIHRGSNRPSSPSNVIQTSLSTLRGMQSPLRARSSTPISLPGHVTSRACTRSSYVVDLQKGKKIASHTEAAHQLRLLYNVLLQWHFVNARNCDMLSFQKIRAEEVVYTAWNNISKFRNSAIVKRIQMQHLKQQTKLVMILKEQMAQLDGWGEVERENSASLSGLFEVLKASTLHVSVSGCSKADVISLKTAVSSAVDVMQAMGLSISYLLSKVNSTMSMASELSVLLAKERAKLAQCKELLASVISLQVQESSLRTHLIQLSRNTMRS